MWRGSEPKWLILSKKLCSCNSFTYVSNLISQFQGHDCCPYQFTYKGPGALDFVKKLDIPKQISKSNMSAMQHFRNLDKKATEEDSNELGTLHQNSIT